MDNILLALKYSAQQLTRVEHQLKPEVAHFERTHVGLGIAHHLVLQNRMKMLNENLA
ncbi:MAG TPA: hypothetical protein VE860_06915 [Chthoniobacterales bacterium]|nr:hypothetical protein [Chthoniobacterales bacterium]